MPAVLKISPEQTHGDKSGWVKSAAVLGGVPLLCSERVRQVIIDPIQSVVGGSVAQYRIIRKLGHLGSAVSLLS